MIIIANWKLNGSKQVIDQFSRLPSSRQIVICPPFPYLYLVRQLPFLVGAQDCSAFEKGAYTGEVSASMLQEMGVSHVILGHSERRHFHKETDEIIREKCHQVQQYGMTPIICLGESQSVYEAGQTTQWINHQIDAYESLKPPFIIAYEPIWSIGSGKIPSCLDISLVHQLIQKRLNSPVLYGGSVTPDTIQDLRFIIPLDGFLIGGASLIPKSLEKIGCSLGLFNSLS